MSMTRTRWIFIGLLVFFLLLLATVGISAPADAAPDSRRPCISYESVSCTWDQVGMGGDTSFVTNSTGDMREVDHCTAHRRIATWLSEKGYFVVGTSTSKGGPVFMNLNRDRGVVAFYSDDTPC